MDLLARREHSRQELFNKLRNKGFSTDEIEAAIERLLSDGLLSDERFAESYVRHRAIAGFGPLRILMELKERGVDEQLIQQVVWQAGIDWDANCYAAWQKKFNQYAPFGSKEYAAQLRFLAQRGYAQELVHKVLKNHD